MGDVIQSDAFIQNVASKDQIEGIAKVLDAVEEPSAEKAKELFKKIEEMGEVTEE